MGRTIVIGAGSAGAVIAARATEGNQEVLLLEAGPDYASDAAWPSDLRNGRQNSFRDHDWGYWHSPTPGQSPFVFPRGKVVGGSSAVNTCIALRGQPYDYDEWADAGLPEWSWQHCRPAFLKLEHDLDFQNEHHGNSGPIPIRRHTEDELVPWQRGFLEASESLGFRDAADFNIPNALGAGAHPMNKVEGERMSAARCYLTSNVRARENFTLRAATLVRRILFHNESVCGVEVESPGRVEVLDAEQVVLSAGALNTVAILYRSGIGPDRKLRDIGVSVVSNVPGVGARLLDHPGAATVWVPKQPIAEPDDPSVQCMLRFTSTTGDFAGDMIVQPGSTFTLPDLTLPLVGLACSVGKPRGVGSIAIKSADPHAAPVVCTESMVDPEDRRRAIEALEIAYLLATSPAMRDMAYPVYPNARLLSDSRALDSWLWRSSGSSYHPCGSVPMGRDSDPNAALDGRGHVRGVQGLVVADASIMPTIPSVNINIPTLMIGERFGEWLCNGDLF